MGRDAKVIRPAIQYVRDKFKGHRISGAEIGVNRGDHAAVMLEVLDIEKLYLVDPWNCYDVDGEYGQWMKRLRGIVKWQRWKSRDHEAVYQSVIARFGADERVNIIRERSNIGGAFIPEESLEFVYLDGSHRYEDVLMDCILYWTRIRPGGVLCGHDFDMADQSEVVNAVIYWADCQGLDVNEHDRDFWIDKSERLSE